MNKELLQPNIEYPKHTCDVVVFDVDSTLVDIEGLDWLADYKNIGDSVKELTNQSMNGTMDFQQAMTQKMEALAPSRAEFDLLGHIYCEHLVDGAQEVVSTLQTMGKEVWLLTGNFRPAVEKLAKKLNIPFNHILCNDVYFDAYGAYKGFDMTNELTHNGGKAQKMKQIAQSNKKIVFIGDGATDLEAKNEVSLFIGFGGIVRRPNVHAGADVYIAERSLMPLLHMLS